MEGNMKTVVVYKSKTGYTRKYAEWIAEDANANIFKVQDITIEQLMKYDTIVYCGGLYAGGILGFPIIKKNFKKLLNKKIVVVAVGAGYGKEKAKQEIINKNLTSIMKDNINFFLLRGGLNYKKMKFIDKFSMFLLVKYLKLKKKEALNNEDKGMIKTYGKVVDFTNRDAIKPIIEIVK
jgi:menaquinone-dependent protoporphyrinogen IX oxidase